MVKKTSTSSGKKTSLMAGAAPSNMKGFDVTLPTGYQYEYEEGHSAIFRNEGKRSKPRPRRLSNAPSTSTNDPPGEDEVNEAACEIRRVTSFIRNMQMQSDPVQHRQQLPQQQPQQQHRSSWTMQSQSQHLLPHPPSKQNQQCGPPPGQGRRSSEPPLNDSLNDKKSKKKLQLPKLQPLQHCSSLSLHQEQKKELSSHPSPVRHLTPSQHSYRRSKSSDTSSKSIPVDDHRISHQGEIIMSSQTHQVNKSRPTTISAQHEKPCNYNPKPKSRWTERKKKSKEHESSSSRPRLSPTPVQVFDNSMGRTIISNGDHEIPAKKSINVKSDTSIQKLIDSGGDIATIDPSEEPSLKEVANYDTHLQTHTADELRRLIETMQLEFQTLQSSRENAETKAFILEKDLIRTQQERDAGYMRLREEVECWRRESQRERVRGESLKQLMQVEMDHLKGGVIKLNIDWSRAMLGKSELKVKIDALENENRRLKEMLLSKQQHLASRSGSGNYNCEGNDGQQHTISKDGYNGSYVSLNDTRSHDHTGLEETSYRDDGSVISFISATAAISAVSMSLNTNGSQISQHHHRRRSSGPPSLVSHSSQLCASSHWQVSSSPQHGRETPQHNSWHHQSAAHVVRHRCKDNISSYNCDRSPSNNIQQAPASWHGGKNNKTSSAPQLPRVTLPFAGGSAKTTLDTPPPLLPPRCKTRSSRYNSNSHKES